MCTIHSFFRFFSILFYFSRSRNWFGFTSSPCNIQYSRFYYYFFAFPRHRRSSSSTSSMSLSYARYALEKVVSIKKCSTLLNWSKMHLNLRVWWIGEQIKKEKKTISYLLSHSRARHFQGFAEWAQPTKVEAARMRVKKKKLKLVITRCNRFLFI